MVTKGTTLACLPLKLRKNSYGQIKKKCYKSQHISKSSYGGVKKSLGAGKSRGIFGKFVPPVSKQDGDEQNERVKCKPTRAESAEPVHPSDDRLKNVEPKMIELITNEIMDHGPPVHWEDIAGVEFAKATIKEIVVWPIMRPDIFTGLRRPPKGILLFGPPGTGKTDCALLVSLEQHSSASLLHL